MFDINFVFFGWLPVFFCLILNMEQKIETWKIVIGAILTPLMIALFFADRVVMIALPHLESKTIKKWFNNMQFMGESLLRVSVISLVVIIFKLITWMIA